MMTQADSDIPVPPLKRTLWIDLQQGKYFLVPDTDPPTPGETTVVTLAGKVQRVDPGWIARWEVSDTEARAHMQSEIFDLFGSVKGRISSAFGFLQPEPQDVNTPGSSEQALQMTARILGVSTESLQNRPDVSRVGLHNIFSNLANLLEHVISGDEERFQKAKREVIEFRQDLEAMNVEITPAFDALPEQIRTWYQASEQKAAFREIVTALHVAAEQLQRPPEEGGKSIDQVFASLSRAAQDAIGTQQAVDDETRYRELARKSIEESMAGAPKFDFKKLWEEHNKDNPTD